MRIARSAFPGRGGACADGAALLSDKAVYGRFFPYYAELCALSEIRKKPGFGVQVRSGMGGHSLLYLSGVCLDRQAGYPTLKLCDPGAWPARHGVGISVNSHYKNANWVAAGDPDFPWRGALAPGERLTRDAYERTQDCAKAMGILDGVQFHDHLFRDKPHCMSERDYMYEISIATDYAVCFGRDTYRARIPLERRRMGAMVDFLNDLNETYRDGRRVFRWKALNNNCSHVAHNALAVAAIWSPWPTGQILALAAFNFPVPKNEFVDLMLRTNDLPIQDAASHRARRSRDRRAGDSGERHLQHRAPASDLLRQPVLGTLSSALCPHFQRAALLRPTRELVPFRGGVRDGAGTPAPSAPACGGARRGQWHAFRPARTVLRRL
jgi:hypothetical protein